MKHGDKFRFYYIVYHIRPGRSKFSPLSWFMNLVDRIPWMGKALIPPPLLSSKRRPHFKTRKWSCDPTWPEVKNNCAGEGQQQITALVSAPWLGVRPVAVSLYRQDNTTQKKRRLTSIHGAEFEPPVPMFELQRAEFITRLLSVTKYRLVIGFQEYTPLSVKDIRRFAIIYIN
jgi:hypothetical protein